MTTINRIPAIIISLLFYGTVFAQQIIDWREIETFTDSYQRVIHYKKGEGKTLDGIYRIKRRADVEVVNLNNGIINGKYQRLRDGKLREEGNYTDGRRDGLFVEYYQDGSTHRKDTPMKSGKIDGMVISYYQDGKKESEKEYYQSIEHGTERRYSHDTGAILIEGKWKDGKKEGVWKEVFDAGNGVWGTRTLHYCNGELNGPYCVEMTKDGQPYITIHGQFSEGRKVGKWSQYDSTLGSTREWEEK